ncbi:MAG: hypothetical protein U0793_25660 [Gemmataceae bacterium]
MAWVAIPMGTGAVPAGMAVNAVHTIQGMHQGPGMSRIRISPTDVNPGNDLKMANLP